MADETVALQQAVAALQARNVQLEDKLRALEQSYTIDKRTVLLGAATLSALVVGFTGFSLTQMPDKVMDKIEASVATRTGKSIDARMKAIDAAFAAAESRLQAAGSSPEAITKSLDGLAQRIDRLEARPAAAASAPDAMAERVAQLERRRPPTIGVVSVGAASQKRLKYSDLGYVITEGYQLDCDPGAWISGLRVYTNKDSKFAGITLECKAPAVALR